MKHLLKLFLLAMLVCLPLYGAQDEPGDENQAAEPAETTPGDDADTQVQQAQENTTTATTDDGLTIPPSDEDFVPTVRITEDLPVAFPVDI